VPMILVVDDEQNIRDLVGVYLTAAGYSVEYAADGPSALDAFHQTRPDLVILDIMMPGMSGEEVCVALRAESIVPIIMLTARDTDMAKVALLESGADDYIVKPFSPPELVARVRAVLRRAGPAGEPVDDTGAYHLGGLVMDVASREVTLDGTPVALTAREFDLLLPMVRRPGVVFTREQLLESAIGYADYAETRGVDVHIRHIREKLDEDVASPRFIETVRGVGYRVRRDAP